VASSPENARKITITTPAHRQKKRSCGIRIVTELTVFKFVTDLLRNLHVTIAPRGTLTPASDGADFSPSRRWPSKLFARLAVQIPRKLVYQESRHRSAKRGTLVNSGIGTLPFHAVHYIIFEIMIRKTALGMTFSDRRLFFEKEQPMVQERHLR